MSLRRTRRHGSDVRRRTWVEAVVLFGLGLLLPATSAQAQSAQGTVVSSATILDPVSVEAPGALRLVGASPASLELRGEVGVTSPSPHVLTASIRGEATMSGDGEGFARLRQGTRGRVPQRVEVDLARSADGRPVRVTYVLAVVL